ncbi:MAG: hypothetical protein ACLSX2_00810 [Christensenellaceae bacterium]
MGKKRRGGRSAGRWIAILGAVAVIAAAAVAGLYHFGVIGKGRSSAAALSAALEQWTDEWQRGDASSLSAGMVFGVSDREHAEPDETEDGALSAGDLKKIMEEQYSELIEAPAETEAADGVFPILMQYTSVSYTLPQNVEAGQWVSFEITGPDMTKIIARLDENDGQEALFSELEAILAVGNYETRTVSARAGIEALDDGYRLRNDYELMDGLYGGLISVVSDALPKEE